MKHEFFEWIKACHLEGNIDEKELDECCSNAKKANSVFKEYVEMNPDQSGLWAQGQFQYFRDFIDVLSVLDEDDE